MLRKCLLENKPDNLGFGTSVSGFEKRWVTRVPENPGLPTLGKTNTKIMGQYMIIWDLRETAIMFPRI